MKVSIENGERGEITVPGGDYTAAHVSVCTTHADLAVCEVFIRGGRVVEVRVRADDGVLDAVFTRGASDVRRAP